MKIEEIEAMSSVEQEVFLSKLSQTEYDSTRQDLRFLRVSRNLHKLEAKLKNPHFPKSKVAGVKQRIKEYKKFIELSATTGSGVVSTGNKTGAAVKLPKRRVA